MHRFEDWISEEHMSRRGFLSVIAAGSLASVIAGCGGQGTSSSSAANSGAATASGHGKKIGLVLNGFNEYDQAVASGVLKQLEGTGYGFVGAQGNFQASAEVSNFDSMISRKVAGIIVVPTTTQSVARGTLAAKQAGIPVVNASAPAPTPVDRDFVARINVDNHKGGLLIAKWLTEHTKSGEVLVVSGTPGQGFSEMLTAGLRAGLKQYGGGDWRIVAEQPGNYVQPDAIKAAQNMLTAHPDAKIIVNYAAEMGNGIASFLQKTKRRDIVNVTSDGNLEMVPYMRNGWVTADRYYSGAGLGRLSAKLLLKNIEEGTVTKDVVLLEQGMASKSTIASWLKRDPLFYTQYRKQIQGIG